MKNINIFVLFLTLFALSDAVELDGVEVPQDKLIYYLFIGHSNMMGYGGIMDTTTHPKLWCFDLDDGFYPAKDPIGTIYKSPSPVMPFLKKMAEYYPGYYFCGVKIIQAGMLMKDQFSIDRPKYVEIKETVDSLKNIATLGGVCAMFGLVEGVNDTFANAFSEDFTNIINTYRENFGVPDLPCILGKYEENADTSVIPNFFKYKNIVIKQIANVPGLDPLGRTFLTPKEAVPANFYYDDHHYNEKGYKIWSQTAANIIRDNDLDFWATSIALKLVKPSLSDTFLLSDTIPVTWKYIADSLTHVYIHLSIDSGIIWHKISGNSAIPAQNSPFLWKPAESDLAYKGKELLLRISNKKNLFHDTSATFSILIPNKTPYFTTTPIETAKEGELYTYNISCNDSDKDESLIIKCPNKPAWLTFTDSGNGTARLSATPKYNDIGHHIIELTVTDNYVKTPVKQGFIITVDSNSIPMFVNCPYSEAIIGTEYKSKILVSDHDSSNLYVSLENKPDWLTVVNIYDGLSLTGTPNASDIGTYSITATVTDNIISTPVSTTFKITINNSFPIRLLYPTGNEHLSFFETINVEWIADTKMTFPVYVLMSVDSKSWHTISGTSFLPVSDNKFICKPWLLPFEILDRKVRICISDSTDTYKDTSQYFSFYKPNYIPKFTSTPVETAKVGNTYKYVITASDLDKTDTISFSSTNLPLWLKLSKTENGSAILSGIPSNNDNSMTLIVISLVDNHIEKPIEQAFYIKTSPNSPPYFISQPKKSAIVNQIYNLKLVASDPDTHDFLSISAISIPDWLQLTDNKDGTAKLVGTPENNDVGISTITLAVSDNICPDPIQLTFTLNTTFDSTLAITFPNGGEVFDVNSVVPIHWTYNPKYVQLLLIKVTLDSGKTWHTISGDIGLKPETNVFYWHPYKSELPLTNKRVKFKMINYGGNIIAKSKYISFVKKNNPPKFTSTPEVNAKITQLYHYIIKTSDPDQDTKFIISAPKKPSWLFLGDSTNGCAVLSGIPTDKDYGKTTITIELSDSIIPTPIIQTFTIDVQFIIPIIGNNATHLPIKESFLFVAPNPVSLQEKKINFSYNPTSIHSAILVIYDIIGNEIFKTDILPQQKGRYEWNMCKHNKEPVVSGSYLAVLYLTQNDGAVVGVRNIIGVKN